MSEKQQEVLERQPPSVIQLRYCQTCGRDDRVSSFKDRHYSRGELCTGVPVTVTYMLQQPTSERCGECQALIDRLEVLGKQMAVDDHNLLLTVIRNQKCVFPATGAPNTCPDCGRKMNTRREGDYVCYKCGYSSSLDGAATTGAGEGVQRDDTCIRCGKHQQDVMGFVVTDGGTVCDECHFSAPATIDGIAIIAAERQRHFNVEGWTPEHDDEHDKGELAQAAACYAWPPMRPHFVKTAWPWRLDEWKPELYGIPGASEQEKREARIRVLAKAGALVAAEIDRLRRLQEPRCPNCGALAEDHLYTGPSGDKDWRCPDAEDTAPATVADGESQQ